MTDYLYLPTDAEAERVRKELKARGVTGGNSSWVAEQNCVYAVKDGKIHLVNVREANNATLAKIPKLEPCVVIRHEVQEEGVLRLLDELGVRWQSGCKASEFKSGRGYPYKLRLDANSDRKRIYSKAMSDHSAKPQSTKDFMEGVENALL
jgi:hypothetical protein